MALPAKPPLKGEVPALGGRRGSPPKNTLQGRGGSVSRRDHNQAAGTRSHPSGGTKPEKTSYPKRQPLFRREGSGGRGASLREAASPPSTSPTPSLEEGARGRGLFYQKSPLPRNHFITTYEFFRCLPWGARSGRGRCPARQRPDRRSGDGGDCRGKRRRRPECAHGSPFRGDGRFWRADPP